MVDSSLIPAAPLFADAPSSISELLVLPPEPPVPMPDELQGVAQEVLGALAELEAETRALLRERFAAGKAKGLKALLASAPLEGIELNRDRDFGRVVSL